MPRARLGPVLLLAGLGACADDGTTPSDVFGAAVDEVVIEVDYAPGAEPFVGGELLVSDVWQLTRSNLEALFSQAPKTVTIDDTLAEMDALADAPGGPDYDADELLAIADRERSAFDGGARRAYYVLFVDGYFAEDGERQGGVLGVSLGDTGVIAMFKPVIRSAGSARLIEQTTLVHELGHAFGLVANGVPAQDPSHHDTAHGAHCGNDACVMYWQNEVGASLAAFVADRLRSGSAVIFDQDCLDDAWAAAAR